MSADGESSFAAPLLGVVTVTYNSASFLDAFFQSCEDQTLAQYRVYAIDNKSSDASAVALQEQAVRDPRFVPVINDVNTGVAAGNNRGIEMALREGCEWVLLLNNDTAFPPGMFRQLADACRGKGWRVAVPKIYYDTPADHLWYAGGGFDPRKGYAGYHAGKLEKDLGQYDGIKAVDYSPTCAMLVHRSVFYEVGLMDESYFVYFDDTDFCWRLKKHGIAIGYWPNATLIHKVGGSTGGGESVFSAFMTSRNRLYFLRKHFGLLVSLFWLPIFVAYYVARYVITSRRLDLFAASLRGTMAFRKLMPGQPTLTGVPPAAARGFGSIAEL